MRQMRKRLMKKMFRGIGRLLRRIATFFDKWLITPITKLVLNITEFVKSNSKSIDRIISRKSTLLVISLILAFAVFVIIDQESDIMIDKYAEILENQPVSAIYNEELYVVEGIPKAVDITLIGQRRHIFLAKQSPSKNVSVDLTGLKPGTHSVTLKYTQRLKSLEYKLDPSKITVKIYDKESETRSLTYDILHQDDLDSKLSIKGVELDRTDVIVKGAKYKLEQVATVKALVDVNEIPNPEAGEITVRNVPLVAYDTNGKIIDVEIVPKVVDAKVNISSPRKEVSIKVIPKGTLAVGKAIKSIQSEATSVVVYGEESAVEKLNTLEVEVDVDGLDSDKDFNVTLKKPAGITDLSIKNLKVKVSVDNAVTKEFEGIRVSAENLPSGYKAQALSQADSMITVVVSGSADIIEKIDASSIKAYIDLTNYGVGEHQVKVVVIGDDLRLTYKPKTKEVKIRVTQE